MYPDKVPHNRHLRPKSTDYEPHEFSSLHDTDLLFYHVYDTLSGSPLIKGKGITAPARKSSRPYRQRITAELVLRHLDPSDRQASSLITLYDDQTEAVREGRRRMKQPYVWNHSTARFELRGPVEIAILGAQSMSESGVFYFSAGELCGRRMLDLGSVNVLRRGLKGCLWFAMDSIPDCCVEGMQMLECCESSKIGDFTYQSSNSDLEEGHRAEVFEIEELEELEGNDGQHGFGSEYECEYEIEHCPVMALAR